MPLPWRGHLAVEWASLSADSPLTFSLSFPLILSHYCCDPAFVHPKQSLCLLHMYPAPLLVNGSLHLSGIVGTTECLPQSFKTFRSSSIHLGASPVSSSLFVQTLLICQGWEQHTSTPYFAGHDAPKGVLLLCDGCIYGHSLKLHRFSLLPNHTKKVEAWCTVYRGSHSVKPEKRVTHRAAVIGHVHLAIFLFKSLL